MCSTRLYRSMVGLILLPVTFGASLQHPQQARVEQDLTAPTRKHIVDCVEPLCREVLPRNAKLLFRAKPVASTSVRSRKASMWTVECLDEWGEQRLHLLWNAENNSLVSLHQLNLRDTFLSHPPLSKPQAIHASRAWIERLRIVPPGDSQRFRCTVEMEHSACDIHFHLKEQRVSVGIHAHSDELLFVYVNSVPPHP